jgi:large subunit ribosomal protein L6
MLCLLKIKEMSRIGKLPINIPANVTLSVANDVVTVKGPLGELKQSINPNITVKVEDGHIIVSRPDDEKENRSMHGLYRALIANMVKGVSEGFITEQEFVGVGYKAIMTGVDEKKSIEKDGFDTLVAEAKKAGNILEMSLGFSHGLLFQLPSEISAVCKNEKRGNSILIMKCIDKQLLGQVSAKIRSLRPPEPYKGKGIRFVNEELRRKAGKSAKA